VREKKSKKKVCANCKIFLMWLNGGTGPIETRRPRFYCSHEYFDKQLPSFSLRKIDYDTNSCAYFDALNEKAVFGKDGKRISPLWPGEENGAKHRSCSYCRNIYGATPPLHLQERIADMPDNEIESLWKIVEKLHLDRRK